ncbi:hypothetical protein [Roseovarius aestuariivivens]|uniref:hypothetical protein n=1 Tax=Roseovarius aestuariivivens TaxID=1888910 RepID=UPI001FD91193|nr:hypothetical protein [Roseovarius aestuariivivens]
MADPARGTLMGNRGILHDDGQRLGTSRWKHPHWVTCLLEYKGRKRSLMAPSRYTELFFLDEVTALAAGHRPCGECRRDAFRQFTRFFHAANGTDTLKELDRCLHRARVTRQRAQIRHNASAGALPDGTFILIEKAAHVLWGSNALRYTTRGYTSARARPAGPVTVLTPAPAVAALAQGYIPALHPSAAGLI